MQFDKDQLNQLYRYALSLENNPDRAYDLLQGALEKYLNTSQDEIINPLAYIKRIIRNLSIDSLRLAENRLKVDRNIGDEDELASPSLSTLNEQTLYEEELEELLVQLSPQERELLFLWAIEGYTIDEIARWQNIAKGTLLSRIHRLRARLKADNPKLAASLRGAVH